MTLCLCPKVSAMFAGAGMIWLLLPGHAEISEIDDDVPALRQAARQLQKSILGRVIAKLISPLGCSTDSVLVLPFGTSATSAAGEPAIIRAGLTGQLPHGQPLRTIGLP